MAEHAVPPSEKSPELAHDMMPAVTQRPLEYNRFSSLMIPGVPIELAAEESIFTTAGEFLDANPEIGVRDLKHNRLKTWDQQIFDLSALIVLSERALASENPVAKEGVQLIYKGGKNPGAQYRNGTTVDGVLISPEHFERGMIGLLRQSCELYARETEEPKERLDKYILKPNEMRVIIESTGIAGEKLPLKEIVASEGVKHITGQKTYALQCIRWSFSAHRIH